MAVDADAHEKRNVTHRILETVAARTDTAIRELPPLYGAVDPDALNTFLRCPESSDDPGRSVRFTYCGYRVTVDSTGQVQLDPES